MKNHYESQGAKQQAGKDIIVMKHDKENELIATRARELQWRKGIIL